MYFGDESRFPSQAALEFREPLHPTDFTYHHTMPRQDIMAEWLLYRTLEPAFIEAEDRFGISVTPLKWGELPENDGQPFHCLVGPLNPLEATLEERKHLARLAAQPGARVNLAPIYPFTQVGDSLAYLGRAAVEIPGMDHDLGINTIFADDTDGLYYGARTVSKADIVDNLVCETIRLKYMAEKDTSDEAEAALTIGQSEAIDDVYDLSRIYDEYGLWHRSTTDGAFMVHTSQGWLTTQTKTDKTMAGIGNMSLVRDYSPLHNSVAYVGDKLPSSDVPEFLVAGDYMREVMRRHKDIKLVAHFHHNPTTRSNAFPEIRTAKNIEYGVFESGPEIIQQWRKRINQYGMILKEHGVLWVGSTTQELEDFVRNYLKVKPIN